MSATHPADQSDALRLSAFVANLDDVEPPTDAPRSGRCRICGLDGPGYPPGDVFSDAFTSAPAFGPGDHVCYRCRYLANATDYRRYHWIATEDGIETTKDREVLLDTLLDPPEGRWMMQVTDGFLRIMNGWLTAQHVNVSRETYRVLDDTDVVTIERDAFADMVAFARELRDGDDQVAKRVLTGGPNAADYDRYGITRDDAERIDQYRGRGDWRLAVRLVQ